MGATNNIPIFAQSQVNQIPARSSGVVPSSNSSPPPNASAAPTGNNKYMYYGLCDALNDYERKLVEAGTVEQANFYEIKFVPQSLANATLQFPGSPADNSKTAMQQDRSAAAVVNPNTNSMNVKALNRSVSQGMQILQFIELTVRNSSYITNQTLANDDQLNPAAPSTPNSSGSTNRTTDWFRIIVNAVPIGNKVDKKRNDFVYHITYIITTYAINEMQSQYFPPAKFRGIHKIYDYWFTGKNTQVLGYEQNYNTQYFNVLNSKVSAQGPQGTENELESDILANLIGYGIGAPRNVPSPPSQSTQQASNDANTPAATAVDYLYSFADQKTVNLKIIGDPAWLTQGEVTGLTAQNFSFAGFYPDGTVNPEVQQVVFAINFNAPADYDNGNSGLYSGSGLVNVNQTSTQGNSNNLSKAPPQASAAYTAISIKSTFSKGKFEQELIGTALTNLNQKQIDKASGRPSLLQLTENAIGNAFSSMKSALNPMSWASTLTNSITNTPDSASSISNPGPQPASPANPVTSNGDLSPEQAGPPAPPEILLQNQLSGNGVIANVDTSVQIMAAPDA